MRLTRPRLRRCAKHVAALGATASAVVMTLSLSAMVAPGLAGAAVVASNAEIVTPKGDGGSGQPLQSGTGSTPFSLRLPTGAACAADGLNGGRWHTYIVPSSEDPSAVVFNPTGSLQGFSTGSGGAGTFRFNLYSVANQPVRAQAPNQEDAAIINIPNLAFKIWQPGQVPAGTYNLGIACVDLDATPTANVVDHIWNARLQVATAEATEANPAGITWTALAAATPSSSPSPSASASASPSPSPSPSRSASPSPSPSPSPTASPSASPTPSASPSPGGPLAGGGAPTTTTAFVLPSGAINDGGGSSGLGSGGSLPQTGSSVAKLVVSGLLFLIFGRCVILFGRPVEVLEARS